MFDVSLASPLKQKFSKLLRKLLEKIDLTGRTESSKIAVLRRAAVCAFISAWKSVCTYESCQNAAQTIGYFPFNPDKVTQSPYAIDRTEAEDNAYLQRRANRSRIDINSKVITEVDVIVAIANKLRNSPHLGHLAAQPPQGERWVQFVQRVCKKELPNGCYFLGRLPPYVSHSSTIHTFDD